MRLHPLAGHLLLLALACSSSPAWSAISGTVFRDYNSNGAQGAFEPGIGGMTITAFGLAGTNCGSAVVSANGTYSIPISAIANCTAAPVAATYRLELDPATIPATVGQSFQGAGNLSTLRFAADASTGVGFALNNPSQFFPDYGGEAGDPLSSTETGRTANLMFSTTRFVGPEGLASTTVDGTVGAVVSTIYRAGTTSDVSNTNVHLPAARIHATELQVGAVRGLAYLRGGNRLLASAYSKRHTLWGDTNTGTAGKQFDSTAPDRIYIINRAASGTSGVAVFTTIEAGNENHSTTNLQNDTAWWDLVGRRAFGGIDVSEAEDFLYAANMSDKLIYRTAISGSFTAGTTTSFSIQSLAQQACGLTITGDGPGSISAGLNAASDDNDWVPGGIKFHEGQLYLTVTCTAQTLGEHYGTAAAGERCEGALAQGTGALTNTTTTRNPLDYPVNFVPLRGVVIRANPDGTGQTVVSNFPLNVDRGTLSIDGANLAPAEWLPWRPSEPTPGSGNPRPENGCTRTYTNPFSQAYYPQPWLTDIEFDENNNLLVGVTDRAADQFGSAPDGVGTYEGISGGDVVRVRPDSTDWADGTLTTVGVVTSISVSGAGQLANTEFHSGEEYTATGHNEIATGHLGLALGYNEVMTNAFDPPPDAGNVNRPPPNQASTVAAVRSGGVIWLSSTNDASPTVDESRNQSYMLFSQAENGTFGKAAGIGDIELIADLAPLQIGNRVWLDRNGNGVQDPDAQSTAFVEEPGVANVRLFLVDGAGAKLGEATTDAQGNYLFSLTRGTSDGNVNDAAVILANPYAQTLRVVLFSPLLLTTQDVGEAGAAGTTAAGLRDSDAGNAVVTGTAFGGATRPVITVTTGTAGRSNHSFDFGLAITDYGDLPDTGAGTGAGNYQTTAADGGAVNVIISSLQLGSAIGNEFDGVPTVNADGDVTVVGDEGGLTTFPALRQGVAPTVTLSVLNNSGATRNLCGYLDLNNNGVFDAPAEVVTATVPTNASAQSVNLAFTGTVAASQTYANNNLYGRFRVQENACSPNGFGGAGEVEDYAFPVAEAAAVVGAIPNFCPGQSVTFTITLTNAASRATATNFPVTADLIGTDDVNLAGIPSFADANWAVTSNSVGASLAATTGNGTDINTTATIPAGGSIVVTVQATVANGVSLARTVAADVRPALGSVDALASNDNGSGSSALGTCGGPPTGGVAICPVVTGLSALTANTANAVVNGFFAGAAAVAPSPLPSSLSGRCVRVTSATPVGAANAIAIGDLLLLIQMQGATINSTDTASYGDGTANTPGGATAATAGTHEWVLARSAVQASGTGACAGQSNVIEVAGAGVAGGVINSYAHDPSPATGGRSTFQVVRVPRYSSITFSGTGSLTVPAWNGLTGGVLAVDVTGTVDLGGGTTTRFNAAGLGFRGGLCATQGTDSTAEATGFALTAASTTNARKGEGYAGSACGLTNVSACGTAQGYLNGADGKGAPGNAGGGGQRCQNDSASGGGGGAGGGAGGLGGTSDSGGGNACNDVARAGHGGGVLPSANASEARLLLGGGGGAGSRLTGATNCAGGAGGGIVVIRANAISSVAGPPVISVNGGNAPNAGGVEDVAGGGGGGAGTVVLLTNLAGGTTFANTNVIANGGTGGGANATGDDDGSGGGGGGGRLFVAATAAAPVGARTAAAGDAGTGGNVGVGGTAGFVTLGLDPVNSSPGVKPGFVCDGSSTVPVTIAHVESRNLGSLLEVSFTTASEAGTLGYHVYADGDAGRTRLSESLVLAKSDRGLEKQSYVVRGPQLGASSVTIEEVDVTGKSTFYGPYPLNRSVGEREFTQATDWAAIQTEQAAWRAARVSALRGQGGAAVAELGVSTDGWYRVTQAELLAAGVDLSGVPVAELGLSVGTTSVPMLVEGGSTVDAGTVLSFYGRAVQGNLYTTRQVYRLQQQAGPRLTVQEVATAAGSATEYVHVERQAPNRLYSFSSPLADPWYAARIVRQGTSSPTTSFTVPVSELQAGSAEVSVSLYGGTDLPELDDHHAVLKVNGQEVASAVFDGFAARTLRATVDAALLTASTTVEVAFGPTPYSVDVLHVEAVELRYPRRLQLLDGELRITTPQVDQLLSSGFETTDSCGSDCEAKEYVVAGLNAALPVQVLRLGSADEVALLGAVRDGDTVRFAATGGAGVELLVTQRTLSSVVEAGRAAPAGLLTGSAMLLVIGHASFLESPQSELDRLLLARQAEGLSTKVVDVQDLYRAYSGGVTDARAIAAYVRDAVSALGTRYVLLVGGDTYDYGNYLNLGSVSFVPTLYTPTSRFVQFAPADGLLADLDGDRRANVAVGRLPVRTVEELNRMVDRILAPAAGTTALLVSDREQAGYRYSEQNEQIAIGLPASWTQTHLKLDDVAPGQVAMVRQQLVTALAQGQSLLSWYGHSSPSTWSREGLLTAPQVYGGLLTNTRPTTVVQWGCWGAYFVDPRYNTLAHAFLLNASGGAAGFVGATALTETVSDTALGERLKPLLAEPVRIGDALLEATLALPAGPFDDVTVGTVILGDPSARIRR